MNRKIITLIIILLVLFTSLACLGSSGRVDETPDPASQSLTIIQNLEKQNEESSSSINNAPPAIPPTDSEPAISSTSNSSTEEIASAMSEDQDYSVSATNFGCTCSVDSNTMSISLDINGDQLTYAGNVYNKIADNTYKRSYMGYYILQSGEGENITQTQVDEERHDLIIITNDGFISEHYQGDEGSPCCYHTFTTQK
ncbi:MAG: hypothetical protein IH585_19020 [Anaerolineaceae bacterium]|nr:hypothetical protein [Anaerolineaceae bacterium]